MKAIYSIFVFVSLLLFSQPILLAQSAQLKEYKIYDSSKQREISLEELSKSLGEVDALFWGEEHYDTLGHILQDELYGLLLKNHGTVSLSLEMFESDCQQVVDEYLMDFITESKLIKDGRAWKNYSDAYKPMIEKAKAQNQTVIAANGPRRYINLVSRKGLDELDKLPKSAKQYLPPLPIYTGDQRYHDRFEDVMAQAGHELEERIYQAQCTWDASMAFNVYKHWRKHKGEMIFHLNGSFHTEYQQGTITQLRRYSKKIKISNISCFPIEDFGQPNWSEHVDKGDFIIVSQKAPKKAS